MREKRFSHHLKIKYPSERFLTIRREPNEYERRTLQLSPRKLIESQELSFDNDINISIHQCSGSDFVKLISGGNWDFVHKISWGLLIIIKTRRADEELKNDIKDISRGICKKHLKKCVCFPGLYTTHIRIDEYSIDGKKEKIFFDIFSREIINRVKNYETVDHIIKDKDDIITEKPIKEIEKEIFNKELQEINEELPLDEGNEEDELPQEKKPELPNSTEKESDELLIKNDKQKLKDELKEDIVMKISFFGYLARNATVELVKLNKNYFTNPEKYTFKTDSKGWLHIYEEDIFDGGKYVLRVFDDDSITFDEIVELRNNTNYDFNLKYVPRNVGSSRKLKEKNDNKEDEIKLIISQMDKKRGLFSKKPKYCSNCGTELNNKHKFCKECGKKI